MEAKEKVIEVKHLTKEYTLYKKPSQRLLHAFGIGNKKYPIHRALDDINLDIYKGETVGIIGTNGSGKSTILKIITGVLNATKGEVNVEGRISALLELGAGFNMEYNGIENVYLNGTMMGFSEKEIDEKMESILEFADIGEYVHQPVKTYSSGMFVRLAFAVAINIEPEILIVDEALSVGDVFFQAKCYQKFEEFKEKGKTIVFVSHDLSSISKYCDRVFLLNDGILLGEGSAGEMIDAFKQVLVGQYEDEEKRLQGINSDFLEYGTKQAIIEDIFIKDEKGVETTAILKQSPFSIHMKVKFLETIPAPIFAFVIKDVKGTEVTGTNTMYEKAWVEPVVAGEVKEIIFEQEMWLQGGEYIMSFGLTGYEGEQFCVYHRLYDYLNITVVSDKNTSGYYDMNSKITIK